MNITITGDLGSGKTTVSKLLAEKLQMELVDTGKIYRQFAGEKGLDVLQQNNSDDWSIDRKIDSEVERLGKECDNQIFVSRLAWYFIPDAIKIYLIMNPLLAAKRIVNDSERKGEKHSDAFETLKYNQERSNAELKRYYEMYGIEDARGFNEADIVVVVGTRSTEEVLACIDYAIKNKAYGFYTDPRVLIPTQCIRDFNMNCLEEYRELFVSSIVQTVDAELCIYDHTFFIIDGHHRIAACIKNDVSFIKIEKPYDRQSSIIKTYVYDYEDLVSISLQDELDYFFHNNTVLCNKSSEFDKAMDVLCTK